MNMLLNDNIKRAYETLDYHTVRLDDLEEQLNKIAKELEILKGRLMIVEGDINKLGNALKKLYDQKEKKRFFGLR